MELKDFRIDALLNLYLLLIKDAKCYATPSVKTPVWFTKKSGEIAGKLFSWIENEQGVFMMFKINDNFDARGLNTSYYILLEPKLLQWDYVKRQLDDNRRSQMSWYDKWFEDLETSITAYKDKVIDSAKSGLMWGGAIVGGVVVWTVFLKPMLQAKLYGRLIKTAVKEYRKD